MNVKTSELSGLQLDYAVAVVIDEPVKIINGTVCSMNKDGGEWLPFAYFTPSTAWSQCGPLIVECGVWLSDDEGSYVASCFPHINNAVHHGDTPQIAICRAVVQAVKGSELEIPDELMKVK